MFGWINVESYVRLRILILLPKVPANPTPSGEECVAEDGGGEGSGAIGAGAAAANAFKRRKACGDCPPCRITVSVEFFLLAFYSAAKHVISIIFCLVVLAITF